MATVEVKILKKRPAPQGLKQRSGPLNQLPLRDRLAAELERLLPADAFAIAMPDEGSPFVPRRARDEGLRVRKGGLPDIIIVHRGRALGLELPRGASLNDAQRAVFPRLTRAGMRIEVARSFAEALRLLREMGLDLGGPQSLHRQVAELFRAAQKEKRA